MMDFKGKICPYCKTEFQEGDEIVVCSVCEMPHHKECWIENKACTTFGCTGTIVGAEQYEEEMANNTFCSKCGKPLSAGQKFCSACGTPAGAGGGPHFRAAGAYAANQNVYGISQTQYNNWHNQNAGQPVDSDLYTFVQTNQSVYVSKFQKMQAANTKAGWNWCSFLFGPLWFAYRKMYIIAAAYMGINLVLSLIPFVGLLLSLALSICSGLLGDNIYKQYIDRELQVAKSMDNYNKAAYIAKKGGTNMGAACACVGIMFVISLIVAFSM